MTNLAALSKPAAILLALAVGACGAPEDATETEIAPPPIGEEEAYRPDAVREALAEPPQEIMVETPEMNARRGRILFITNGCVICHQVNGVGGRAAPDMSVATAPAAINPLDFSARMWRGAPAMTALQAIELGYVIDLDAQDIADLAAFAASPEEQSLLTLDSTPAGMRDWFLNEPHWRSDDWTQYLQRGDRIPGVDPDQ